MCSWIDMKLESEFVDLQALKKQEIIRALSSAVFMVSLSVILAYSFNDLIGILNRFEQLETFGSQKVMVKS